MTLLETPEALADRPAASRIELTLQPRIALADRVFVRGADGVARHAVVTGIAPRRHRLVLMIGVAVTREDLIETGAVWPGLASGRRRAVICA